jgi:hypothetical protein
MMSLIHYDREHITINGNKYEFDDFLKLEPNYSVPWGFAMRVYKRGVQHYASDGSNTIYLPLIDPYCVALCNREGELARLVLRLREESEN